MWGVQEGPTLRTTAVKIVDLSVPAAMLRVDAWSALELLTCMMVLATDANTDAEDVCLTTTVVHVRTATISREGNAIDVLRSVLYAPPHRAALPARRATTSTAPAAAVNLVYGASRSKAARIVLRLISFLKAIFANPVQRGVLDARTIRLARNALVGSTFDNNTVMTVNRDVLFVLPQTIALNAWQDTCWIKGRATPPRTVDTTARDVSRPHSASLVFRPTSSATTTAIPAQHSACPAPPSSVQSAWRSTS